MSSIQILMNAVKGFRPSLPGWLSPAVSSLIQEMWGADPACRPAFAQIMAVLGSGVEKDGEGAQKPAESKEPASRGVLELQLHEESVTGHLMHPGWSSPATAKLRKLQPMLFSETRNTTTKPNASLVT